MRQLQGSIINWSNELSQGLVYAFPMIHKYGAGVPYNYAGNYLKNPSVEPVYTKNVNGIEFENITDQCMFAENDIHMPINDVTVMIKVKKTDTTARQSAAFGINNVSVATWISAYIPWNDNIVYFDFGGTSDGTSRISYSGATFGDDIWIFTSGTRGMEIWQNGIRLASNSGGITRTIGDSPMYLGKHSSNIKADLCIISFFYIWDRQFNKQEIQEITNDPYSIFEDDLSLALYGYKNFYKYTAIQKQNLYSMSKKNQLYSINQIDFLYDIVENELYSVSERNQLYNITEA